MRCNGSICNAESARQAAKTEAIEILLSELQQSAVGQHPTDDLTKLSGKWNLLYTSLVIKVGLSGPIDQLTASAVCCCLRNAVQKS